jgi:valyl-tRNA synthetase
VQDTAVEEKKKAVMNAVNSCKEAASREQMQKAVRPLSVFSSVLFPLTTTATQNELKRANNKLEETTKKLNRVQNELAKAKFVSLLLRPFSNTDISRIAEALKFSTLISRPHLTAVRRRTATSARRCVFLFLCCSLSR